MRKKCSSPTTSCRFESKPHAPHAPIPPFQRGRWSEDARLIEYLINWLQTTCVLKGHQLRPAEVIQGPETWREAMIGLLRAGRSHASMAARDDVLRIISQTEPELAAKLPPAKETLDTPDVKIAATDDAD